MDKLNELMNQFAEAVSYADLMAGKQMAKVSAAITKCRIDKNMTQKEFAEFLNVSQSMVSKWESDEYNFTIQTLAEICDKLNLELEIDITEQKMMTSGQFGSYKENMWNHGTLNSNISFRGVA